MHATDVNPDAVACTRATADAHGVGDRVSVIRCDLLGPLRESLRGKVDLLLFNPPYVLTPSEEVAAGGIAAAWAGGRTGGRSSTGSCPTSRPCWRRGNLLVAAASR